MWPWLYRWPLSMYLRSYWGSRCTGCGLFPQAGNTSAQWSDTVCQKMWGENERGLQSAATYFPLPVRHTGEFAITLRVSRAVSSTHA